MTILTQSQIVKLNSCKVTYNADCRTMNHYDKDTNELIWSWKVPEDVDDVLYKNSLNKDDWKCMSEGCYCTGECLESYKGKDWGG